MPLAFSIAAAVCLAASGAHATSSDPWLKITSANFELFTTAGERQGRDLIRYFEQVRGFFAQAFTMSPVAVRPARIVVFKNEKEYQPFRPNSAADAYYQPGELHDFIVMSSASSTHYPVAVHEYTHLMIRQAGVEIPAWLNEGLAELYSTLESRGDKVLVGQVIPGRLQSLAREEWIPLRALLTVDHSSPVYNERSRAGIFYAESWALVHMLSLDPAYSSKLKEFLRAIDQDSCANAFQKVYGQSPEEVEAELHGHFSGNTVRVGTSDVPLPKNVNASQIDSAASLPARLALAELLSNSRNRDDQAKDAYAQLAKDFPANWEVEEARAQFAWQRSNLDEAAQHFARAVELGLKNLPSLLLYARVMAYSGKGKESAAVLLKASQLYPESTELQLELGVTMVRNGNYGAGAGTLASVKKVTVAADAFRLFYNLAYAQYRLSDFAHAWENAGKARHYTKNPEELRSLDRLQAALEHPAAVAPALAVTAPEAPPVTHDDGDEPPHLRRPASPANPLEAPARPVVPTAAGTLEVMECAVLAKLHVRVAGAIQIFVIPDPSNVTIRGSDGRPVELACGPQKPPRPLRIQYQKVDALPEVAGVVISLEFQ